MQSVAGQNSPEKLQHYEFGHLVSSLVSDTNEFLGKVAKEYEQSKEETQKFGSILKALKGLTNRS